MQKSGANNDSNRSINTDTHLTISRFSGIKPNIAELAQQYRIDLRSVKKYYDGYIW